MPDPAAALKPPPGYTCPNCGGSAADAYCSHCGQGRIHENEYSFGHFFRELGHELLHLDSKILRSLRLLLTAPGALTAEHFGGRRAAYVRPLRLYLLATAVFFVCSAWTDFHGTKIFEADTSGRLARRFPRILEVGNTLPLPAVERKFQQVYTLALVLSVAGLTLFLKLLYRASPLGKHLVFALHYIAFVFFVTLVGMLLARALPAAAAVLRGPVLYLANAAYMLLALKRAYHAYQRRWPATIWRWLVLMVATDVVDSLVILISALVAVALA